MRNEEKFNSTFRIPHSALEGDRAGLFLLFFDPRRRGSSPCLKAGVSAAKNLMRGPSEGATSQREGRFHRNSENGENARTCTRNIGLAAVVGLACVVPLLLTISPWLLTGRGIDEFTTIDDLYYSVAVRVSQGQVPYRDFCSSTPSGPFPRSCCRFWLGVASRLTGALTLQKCS